MTDETLADRARRTGSPVVNSRGATFVWLADGAPVVFGEALPATFPPVRA